MAIQLGAGGGGMGFTASACKATGQGAGNSITYTNTQVAGNTVQIQSGGDTALKGATVKGESVQANVGTNPLGSGGNLTIQSLQDQSQYKESNKSAGGSVMVGAGFSGSVNLAKSSIDSNYQSVGEQSAIRPLTKAPGQNSIGIDGQYWIGVNSSVIREQGLAPTEAGLHGSCDQPATTSRQSEVTSADRAACSGSVASWALA